MRLDQKQVHYIELFIAAVIFIAFESLAFLYSFISKHILLASLIISILFIAYATLFVIHSDTLSDRKRGRKISMLLHGIFVSLLVSYIALLVADRHLTITFILKFLDLFYSFGIYFVAFIPIFFLTFFGIYFVRKKEKAAWPMLFAVLCLLVLYYSSKLIIQGFTVNDESFLTLQSVNATLHGVNPYSVSFEQAMYQDYLQIGVSYTTNNMIVGTMDYPALFFLSFMPFYFLSQPTLHNFSYIDSTIEAVVFTFLLLLAFGSSQEDKDLLKPKISLLAFFIFGILDVASITTYLMIALFVVAYSKLESKYAWIFIGLCLSIQEELWVPVFLLLAYSVNNQGLRQGIRNAAGGIAVFLLINGYFMITAPTAYIKAVLLPLNSFLLPNGSSPIGFSILSFFPVLLSVYSHIFEISTILLAVLLLYFNRKELIPLFSMIPFLLYYHSIYPYYSTFLFLFILAVGISRPKKIGWIEKILKKNKRAFYALVASLILLILLLIHTSHMAYENQFKISESNLHLFLDNATNSTVYKAVIHYSNLSNSTIYLYGVSYWGRSVGVSGLRNDSLIGATQTCDSLQCLINVNRIDLPRNATSYNVTATMSWFDNKIPITYVSMEIYNNQYFYVADGVASSG